MYPYPLDHSAGYPRAKKQACDRCRRIKVKCEYTDPYERGPCKRCAKSHNQCTKDGQIGDNRITHHTAQFIRPHKHENVGMAPPSHPNEPYNHQPYYHQPITPQASPYGGERLAWLETRPIINNNRSQREQKIRELQGVMKQVQRELGTLYEAESLKSTTASLSQVKDAQLIPQEQQSNLSSSTTPVLNAQGSGTPASIGAGRDYVREAVRQGLLTLQEAHYFYNAFMTDLTSFVPFTIDQELSLDEAAETTPVLAITLVLVCGCTDPGIAPSTAAQFERYLERIVADEIFVLKNIDLELVRSLLLIALFLKYGPRSLASLAIFSALFIAYMIDLGTDEEAKKLIEYTSQPSSNGRSHEKKKENVPEQEIKRVLERCQTFLAVYSLFSSICVTSSKLRWLKMLPSCQFTADALFQDGREPDRRVVYLADLCRAGHESIQALHLVLSTNNPILDSPNDDGMSMKPARMPFSTIKAQIDGYKRQLQQIMTTIEMDTGVVLKEERAQNYYNADKSLILSFFRMIHFRILLRLNELAMNDLSLTTIPGKTLHDPIIIKSFAYEIISICHQIIDIFVSLTSKYSRLPPYVLVRPANALCALIRLRLILWSLGMVNIRIDVEGSFEKIKSAWYRVRRNDLDGLLDFVQRSMMMIPAEDVAKEDLLKVVQQVVRSNLASSGVNNTLGQQSPQDKYKPMDEVIDKQVQAELEQRAMPMIAPELDDDTYDFFPSQDVYTIPDMNGPDMEQLIKELFSGPDFYRGQKGR